LPPDVGARMNTSSENVRATLSPELLGTDDAAAYLDVKPGTLEVWRCTKRYAIPYLKVGRCVRYRRSDLDAFLESCVVGGNAAAGSSA
jgi:excisionase family DNA binding protein